MKKERRLITVALPYTNNVPHAGNIVGSHLPGDIFARYCRLVGHDTILIGGTDEHGTTSEIAAFKAGISVKELCDEYYKIHKDIYDWFNFSYDNFSRTSKSIHHKTAQEYFLQTYKNGFILEKVIKLPVCNQCNRQLADRYIEGICPNCQYNNARGDQCEKCGKVLDPLDLIAPRCVACGSEKISFKEEPHLFLDLTKLSPQLEKWISSQKHWRVQVRNFALSWIKQGLQPRCITRDLKWGIKVPLPKFKDKVLYVWYEAPVGYISSTKEWHPQKWKKYWISKGAKIYNFIGKDNWAFHTISFPASLIAHQNLNLPYNVVGLNFLNYEGSKISKSKGHGIFCENLPSSCLEPDYWRFYLSFIIPETSDTDFSWNDFKERINKDLIGNFANYVNRSLSFVWKSFDGKIPSGKPDKELLKDVKQKVDEIISNFEKVELRAALFSILKLSDIANRYIDRRKPWETKDKDVVFNCANLVKILALCIQPFLPQTSIKILSFLKCNEKDWKKITSCNLKNHEINEPRPLFRKLEQTDIEQLKKKTTAIS